MSAKRAVYFTFLFVFCAASAQAITIGPSMTKRERESSSGRSSFESSGRYEAVLTAFLKEDFARAEQLAERYAKAHERDSDVHDVEYLRALSLMKLGRFDEARPILSDIEQEASSHDVRAQAAYSLGDSYYFQNAKVQADSYYAEALRKYPTAGEAETIRRLLGVSHPPLAARVTGQFAVEEMPLFTVQVGAFSRERNAERLLNKLLRAHYDAYIDRENGKNQFRVRVGHVATAQAAQSLQTRLDRDGYPTKIFP